MIVRRPTIRVATSRGLVRPVALSHPRRCGAPVCSVGNRSATRLTCSARMSEPRGLGQISWGWKPELLVALQRTNQSSPRRQEEEQRE